MGNIMDIKSENLDGKEKLKNFCYAARGPKEMFSKIEHVKEIAEKVYGAIELDPRAFDYRNFSWDSYYDYLSSDQINAKDLLDEVKKEFEAGNYDKIASFCDIVTFTDFEDVCDLASSDVDKFLMEHDIADSNLFNVTSYGNLAFYYAIKQKK